MKKKKRIPNEDYLKELAELERLRASELHDLLVENSKNPPSFMMALASPGLRNSEILERINNIRKQNIFYDELIILLAETQLSLDQNHFAYKSMTRFANINAAHINRMNKLNYSKVKIGGHIKAEKYLIHKEIFNQIYSEIKDKTGLKPRLKIIIEELDRKWQLPPPPMKKWSSDTLKVWFSERNKAEKEHLLAGTSLN
ncbi:MAG: hypothetical protein WCO61_03370 [Alphaproteobacteria bacterium]